MNNSGHYEPDFSGSQQKTIVSGPPLLFHQTFPLRPPRFDSVQQELNKSSSQNKELQREMERLQSEVTRYKNLQLKASKDCEKYKEERDSVFNEYRLIMSERDQVIKELDKLQTELEAAEARLKNTSSERVVASEELEALRQVSARRAYRTNMSLTVSYSFVQLA